MHLSGPVAITEPPVIYFFCRRVSKFRVLKIAVFNRRGERRGGKARD